MTIAFRTKELLVKEGVSTAYKVMAGFYVFYLSPGLHAQAIVSGLVEDRPTPKEVDWEGMTSIWGKNAGYNLLHAVERTTLGQLENALIRVKEEPGLVEMDYLWEDTRIWTVKLNTGSFSVDDFIKTGEHPYGWKLWNKDQISYAFMIEYLCDHFGRVSKNSGHLLDVLRERHGLENNFYHPRSVPQFWFRLSSDRNRYSSYQIALDALNAKQRR